MTLEDLKKMSSDAEEDEDEDKKQDMFAGGEKSGLAVQNPDQGGKPTDHFKNIMKQAQQNRERPPAAGEQPEPPRPSNFQGRAQTLGGEGEESRVVEDPLQRMRERVQRQQRERVTRTLHLWADGVSIDDGPLFRFDDPANQAMMEEINRGRAPMQLLNVQPDQEVDLNLEPHKDENYVQPKKKYKPFEGQGQRLGSPTPGPEPASSSSASTSAPTASSSTSTSEPPKPDVDESAPTVQLQIRLADGTRLPSRFNTTHTIGDVYAFVNRASAESTQRPYALMTTFPSKELSDKDQVLGEMSDFKRGGVVVQKWK